MTQRRFPKDASTLDRFSEFVMPEPNSGCWLWTGAVGTWGYGHLSVKVGSSWRTPPAHRVAYTLFVGEIPKGLQIDHLCSNKLCVNPAHLEAVTQRENMLRSNGMGGRNARKTHCIHGHPYTPENTTMRRGRSGVQRTCNTCYRERWYPRYREWQKNRSPQPRESRADLPAGVRAKARFQRQRKVCLSPEQADWIDRKAAARLMTFAAIVREIVQQAMVAEQQTAQQREGAA